MTVVEKIAEAMYRLDNLPIERAFTDEDDDMRGDYLKSAAAALQVVIDALHDDDLRQVVGDALYANDGNSGGQRTTAALAAVTSHLTQDVSAPGADSSVPASDPTHMRGTNRRAGGDPSLRPGADTHMERTSE